MNAQWNRLQKEVEHDLGKWQEHLDMRHWDLDVRFKVRDPVDKGYCEVDTNDAGPLRAEFVFYLRALNDIKSRGHREYLVLHELLHLIIPNAAEVQVARVARTILLFERRDSHA